MFKLIGGMAGYWWLGGWGAFLGFLLGAMVDAARRLGAAGLNPLLQATRRIVFLETVFVLMGRLAKADGRVSEAEIAHAEVFMDKLGMTPDHRRTAIEWFKRGAAPDYDIGPILGKFLTHCGRTPNLKEMLLVYLILLAMADGQFHPQEEKLLLDIAARLGYAEQNFRRLLDMVLNQMHFAAGQPDSEAALADAYKALGVAPDSSDAEVKRAWRKLMSRHHPDKLIGQGMPEDMVKLATEQAKEIQLAYDLIKRQRNMA
ncbi:MAG: co-chaperone DjlA [Sideroxydans sp.]